MSLQMLGTFEGATAMGACAGVSRPCAGAGASPSSRDWWGRRETRSGQRPHFGKRLVTLQTVGSLGSGLGLGLGLLQEVSRRDVGE